MNRLAQLLAERGVSQGKLARDLELQQPRISKWIKADRIPLKWAVKIEDYFGVPRGTLAPELAAPRPAPPPIWPPRTPGRAFLEGILDILERLPPEVQEKALEAVIRVIVEVGVESAFEPIEAGQETPTPSVEKIKKSLETVLMPIIRASRPKNNSKEALTPHSYVI